MCEVSNLFGYVTIFKDELLVREFNEYKAVYCGLCKSLGKEYGVLSRAILSYDCTFYALFLLALKGDCPGYEKKMCRCNPLKKCTYVKEGKDTLSKASALSVSSVYFKIVDNISDSKGIKKLLFRLIKPIVKRWSKKAKEKYPYIYKAVEDMSLAQSNAESNPDCHLDMSAEPTANMLKTILSAEGRNNSEKLVLGNLGYHLGRWIYLMDAVDDYEDDLKNGNFNPFKSYKGDNIKDYFNQVLNQSLAETYNSWNLVDVTLYGGIIDNILLKGLGEKQKAVLFSEEKRNGK